MVDFRNRPRVLEDQRAARRLYTDAEIADLEHWARVGRWALALVGVSCAALVLCDAVGIL